MWLWGDGRLYQAGPPAPGCLEWGCARPPGGRVRGVYRVSRRHMRLQRLCTGSGVVGWDAGQEGRCLPLHRKVRPMTAARTAPPIRILRRVSRCRSPTRWSRDAGRIAALPCPPGSPAVDPSRIRHFTSALFHVEHSMPQPGQGQRPRPGTRFEAWTRSCTPHPSPGVLLRLPQAASLRPPPGGGGNRRLHRAQRPGCRMLATPGAARIAVFPARQGRPRSIWP